MDQHETQRMLFVAEFVKDFRGYPAAVRAGLKPESARSYASRALARPEVQAEVQEALRNRKDRIMSAESVLERLTDIANADPNELIEMRRVGCRHCWGVAFGYQRTIGEFNAARARHGKAAKEHEANDLAGQPFEPFDEQGGPGYKRGAEINPQCPECDGQGEMQPMPKDTRDLSPEAQRLYAGLKITKDGVEIKSHDQAKALELLARHHSLLNDKLDVRMPDVAGAIAAARKRG